MFALKARWFFPSLALMAIGSACSYRPHPQDGEQECYQGRCVSGYVCASDNRCYSAGYVEPGTGGALGTGGAVGTGGAPKGTGGAGLGGIRGTGGAPGTGGTSIIGPGGSTGSGGSSSCAPARATGSAPLIDDMADGDGGIIPQDGRMGGWFSFNDGTGTQTPASPGITAKTGWICVAGSGFTSWGIALAVSLNSDASNGLCTYDVSVYQGIRFAIQGSVSGGRVRFGVLTSEIGNATTSVGGTCVASSSKSNDCDDAYGAWLTNNSFSGTASVSCYNGATSPWECFTASPLATSATVSIPFSSMRQEGWGRAFGFNRAHVLHLNWQAKDYYQDPGTGTTTYLGPTSVDICIGALSFY